VTYLIMILVTIVAAVAQLQFSPFGWLAQSKVPLLLAVVLYYSLTRELTAVLVSAAIAGFLQDALCEIPLGYSMICFCVVGLVVNRFREYVITDSAITTVFFGIAAGTLVTMVLHMMLSSRGLVFFSFGKSVLKIFGTGLLCMIATPCVFVGIRSLDRLVGNVQMKDTLSDVLE
jgi:rod shape-determining protein MreD